VHAEELGKSAHVLDFESRAESSLEGGLPCRVIARRWDVIDVHGNHREDGACAKNVDARVGKTMVPTIVDEPIPV
jgi:hypothetical protein